MKAEKQYTEGISTANNKFVSWLENYWYHYKWITLVVAFLVVVVAVCTIQSCTAKSSDINITYAGKALFSESDKKALEGVFSKYLPDEFADDATSSVLSYYILSKEQITEMEKETHADGEDVYVDRSFISSEKENFESQRQTDTSSILFLEPWLYQEIAGNTGSTQVLKPLREIFGETPEGAIDNYGIRLGDTEMYKNNPELTCLPEDTIICLFEKRLWQKEKNYDMELAAFKAFTKLAPKDEASID